MVVQVKFLNSNPVVQSCQVHSSMASIATVANMSEPSFAKLPVSERPGSELWSSNQAQALDLIVRLCVCM